MKNNIRININHQSFFSEYLSKIMKLFELNAADDCHLIYTVCKLSANYRKQQSVFTAKIVKGNDCSIYLTIYI